MKSHATAADSISPRPRQPARASNGDRGRDRRDRHLLPSTSGALAGVLHGLDGVVLDGRPTRRRTLPPGRIVRAGGILCADWFQTLIDLAATLDDTIWEQALEPRCANA
jgi:hypothetical protein